MPMSPAQNDTAKDAIRIGDKAQNWRDATRWGFLLVVFMRIVSVLWLILGLSRWSEILLPAVSIFDSMRGERASAVIFFALSDLLAAIGLWLATPWGGVLWLVVVAAEGFLTLISPEIFNMPRVTLAIDVVLVITYFVLTWHAARERDAM